MVFFRAALRASVQTVAIDAGSRVLAKKIRGAIQEPPTLFQQRPTSLETCHLIRQPYYRVNSNPK